MLKKKNPNQNPQIKPQTQQTEIEKNIKSWEIRVQDNSLREVLVCYAAVKQINPCLEVNTRVYILSAEVSAKLK